MLIPALRWAAACVCVIASACTPSCAPEVPEPYVRVSLPAPAFAGPPRAQLVAFWATTCPGCRAESEALTALARTGDLHVVVVSEDERRADVEAFFGGAVPPELHLRLDEHWGLAHALQVSALPTSLLVQDGVAIARFDGSRRLNTPRARATLRRLLQPPSTR